MAVNEEEVSTFSTAISPLTEQKNPELQRRKPSPKMSHLHISPSNYSSYSQKPTSTLPSLRTTATILLPILSLMGFSLTWYLSEKNGLFWQIRSIFAQQPFPYLPGTNEPLILKYTRVGFIDRYLAVLVTFFAPAISGDFPDMSGFAKIGFGGFGAVWTLMIMESLRIGNRGRLISYITIFGLFIQTITLTCTLPIYLTLHLLTSPISHPNPSVYATALSISPTDLHILPVTIILSYILPTYLMSLPFQNPDTLEGTASTSITPLMHQYFVALWQFFPVLSFVTHWTLKKAYIFINWRISGEIPIADQKHDPLKSPSNGTTTTKQTAPNRTDYLRAVRPIYRSLLGFLILTHLPTLFSTLLPPNISSTFYLKPRSASFTETFIPANPFPLLFPSSAAASLKQQSFVTFPKHILTFLQYDIYIATLSLLLWSYYLHHAALSEKSLLDPNSLPSYSPSLHSPTYCNPYAGQPGSSGNEGFFARDTNPRFRDLLGGAGNHAAFGKAYALGGRGRWVRGVAKWVGWLVVGGPMAVVVLMVWERDELVRRKVKQGN